MIDLGLSLGLIGLAGLYFLERREHQKLKDEVEATEASLTEAERVVDHARLMIQEDAERARLFLADYRGLSREDFLAKWTGFRP